MATQNKLLYYPLVIVVNFVGQMKLLSNNDRIPYIGTHSSYSLSSNYIKSYNLLVYPHVMLFKVIGLSHTIYNNQGKQYTKVWY